MNYTHPWRPSALIIESEDRPSASRNSYRQRHTTRAVILGSDGGVCLLSRLCDEGQATKFKLPGGALEPREGQEALLETPLEAVKREVQEEVDVVVTDDTNIFPLARIIEHRDIEGLTQCVDGFVIEADFDTRRDFERDDKSYLIDRAPSIQDAVDLVMDASMVTEDCRITAFRDASLLVCAGVFYVQQQRGAL